MTSAHISEEDACYRARNLCVFSHVQKGTPELRHKGCVLQRLSLGALSDITVVLGMRQSIGVTVCIRLQLTCQWNCLSLSVLWRSMVWIRTIYPLKTCRCNYVKFSRGLINTHVYLSNALADTLSILTLTRKGQRWLRRENTQRNTSNGYHICRGKNAALVMKISSKEGKNVCPLLHTVFGNNTLWCYLTCNYYNYMLL